MPLNLSIKRSREDVQARALGLDKIKDKGYVRDKIEEIRELNRRAQNLINEREAKR